MAIVSLLLQGEEKKAVEPCLPVKALSSYSSLATRPPVSGVLKRGKKAGLFKFKSENKKLPKYT